MYRLDRYHYRAKRLAGDKGWVYGGYHKFLPYTPSPVVNNEAEKKYLKDIKHIIITESFSDWNMPRELMAVEVNPFTVCQCTGLLCNKKVVLYEEDIVKYHDSLYVVRWNLKRLQLVLDKIGSHETKEIRPESTNEIIVVGNTIDNPDFLSEG